MIDKIRTWAWQLKKVSKPATFSNIVEYNLPHRIRRSAYTGWVNGFGLAAIQIGVPIRYAWFTLHGKEYELINPKILDHFGTQTVSESCLSIPNKIFTVDRYYEIEYESLGRKFKAKGIKAQIIQHEIDHMDGILLKGKYETLSKPSSSLGRSSKD